MRTLTIVVAVLLFPTFSWPAGCWNANTQRWQWCPENPYQTSAPGTLFGASAAFAQSSADIANNMAWQRLREHEIAAEGIRAGQAELWRTYRMLLQERYRNRWRE